MFWLVWSVEERGRASGNGFPAETRRSGGERFGLWKL